MSARNIIWWGVYCIIAVWLQRLVPGLDACAPGLLLSMQENDHKQTALLLLLFILVQEGGGTMIFGGSILWYGGIILLFCLGCWFFMSESLMFMLLLSAMLGGMRWLTGLSMSALAGSPISESRLMDESITQAVATLIIWSLAHAARRVKRNAPAPQ